METDNSRVPPSSSSRNAQRNLLLISWCCIINGSFVGYAASSMNGAFLFIARDMHLQSVNVGIGLLTSCFGIGAGAGSILSGIVADKFGRKRTLLCANLFYTITISATALAPNFSLLVVSRTLLGFASGAINVIAPVLLAELCTADIRTRKLAINQLLGTAGEAVVSIVSAVLGNLWFENAAIWRWIFWFALMPAILVLIFVATFVPESPRWLAKMGRADESLKILQQIRRTNAEIDAEMREIELVLNGDESSSTTNNAKMVVPSSNVVRQLRTPWMRRVLLLGIGIAMIQQGTGADIGMKFGTFMLGEAGISQRNALLLNILIGMVAVVSTSVGLWLVTQVSLRRMMMVAQLGIICIHLAIAAVSALLPPDLTRGWITLGLLLVFMIFVHGNCLPITSVMKNEIFPLDMRGFGKGVAILAVNGTGCVLNQMFPIFLNLIGQSQTFALFALIGLFALLFAWRFLPETHGKSLEKLEQQFKANDWKALKKRCRKTHEKTFVAAATDGTEAER